jgi:hypothetical protein
MNAAQCSTCENWGGCGSSGTQITKLICEECAYTPKPTKITYNTSGGYDRQMIYSSINHKIYHYD